MKVYQHTPIFFLLFVALLITAKPSLAETRTFTNKAGNQITAEVKGISAGKVSVLRNGTPLEIPVSSLIQEDIDFLKAWLAKNPSYAIRVKIFPQKGESKLTGVVRLKSQGGVLGSTGSQKDPRSGQIVSSIENEHFVISVTNDSSIALEDATIDYRVFVTELSDTGFRGSKKRMYREKGTIPLKDLAIKETRRVSTDTIELKNTTGATTLRDTIRYTDGTSITTTKSRRNRTRPEVQGIWIRVKVGDQIIEDYKELGDTLDEVTWD